MDKLSNLLPASPRVKSVDLKNAKPVRPGAPNFGAPNGMTSKDRDRISLSDEGKDLAFQDSMGMKNPREGLRAQMAEEVTKRFFETRLNQPEPNQLARGERVALETVEAPNNIEEPTPTKMKLDVQA